MGNSFFDFMYYPLILVGIVSAWIFKDINMVIAIVFLMVIMFGAAVTRNILFEEDKKTTKEPNTSQTSQYVHGINESQEIENNDSEDSEIEEDEPEEDELEFVKCPYCESTLDEDSELIEIETNSTKLLGCPKCKKIIGSSYEW